MTKVTHLTLDERGSLSRKRIHLREISGEADAPLETVGQDLRAARLRRGDDLATVSRALKIRKDHLEALEEDRFEALPGRAYAVGFVRSYADYLGLDPLQSVERFKVEIAGRAEAIPTVGPAPENETVRLPQGWIIMGVVAVFLVVWIAYHLARSADTLLRQQVATTTQSPTAASPIAPPHRAAPAVTVAPAVVNPKPAAPTMAPPGAPSTLPSLTATSPAPGTQTANPPPGTTAALQPGAPVATPLPNGHAYGDTGHDVRVVLKATAAIRVLVQSADGKVLENRTLQPGDSYRVPNKVGLTLTTPNGGAIGVELDGQPMGYASNGARMTEALSLDPQAIVDRYNHSNPG